MRLIKLVCIKGLRRVSDYRSYQDANHFWQAEMVGPCKMKAERRTIYDKLQKNDEGYRENESG